MAYPNSRTFIPVSAKHPCPVCGKPDNCNVVGDTGDVYCRRIASPRQGRDGGWFHRIADYPSPTYPVRNRSFTENVITPAPPEALDRIYRRLLSACPLSSTDRAHLANRCLTDEQIGRHGYASLPKMTPVDRQRLVAQMLEGESDDMVGRIPGLYREHGHLAITGSPGIMIPVVEPGMMIIGIRIRHTEASSTNRYSWVSSKGKPDGCGGAPLHVAIPVHCTDTSTVIITEGEIKANIAADKLGRPVISVPGVTITEGVVPLLEQLGAATVWIAYDSDAASKPAVAQAEQRLIRKLADRGFAVRRLSWPSHFKGIDDALSAGCSPVADAVHTVANEDEMVRLKRQLDEERAYTASVFRMFQSTANGPEAITAAAIIHDLKNRRIPVNEAVPMTRERMSQIGGISTKTATDHKKKIGKHYPDALEFETRHIPRRVVAGTGEIKPPHDLVFVRLKVAPAEALRIVADYCPATAKNGNGGYRPKRPVCPQCGPDAGVTIESRFRCAACDAIIKVTEPRTLYRSTAPGGHSVPRVENESQNGFPLTTTLSTGDRPSPDQSGRFGAPYRQSLIPTSADHTPAGEDPDKRRLNKEQRERESQHPTGQTSP